MQKLVEAQPKLEQNRVPAPFPGKRWPTHVAWHIEYAERRIVNPGTAKVRAEFFNTRTLQYVGKPNRYRALQAWKLLQQARQGKCFLLDNWQAEFDKAGLLAYTTFPGAIGSCTAFFAYHPHSAQVEIVQSFIKPLYLKYVGGMRLYSQKKKLAQDAVDAYYEWYHKHFKRKLRRPKAVPTAIVGGELVSEEGG